MPSFVLLLDLCVRTISDIDVLNALINGPSAACRCPNWTGIMWDKSVLVHRENWYWAANSNFNCKFLSNSWRGELGMTRLLWNCAANADGSMDLHLGVHWNLGFLQLHFLLWLIKSLKLFGPLHETKYSLQLQMCSFKIKLLEMYNSCLLHCKFP